MSINSTNIYSDKYTFGKLVKPSNNFNTGISRFGIKNGITAPKTLVKDTFSKTASPEQIKALKERYQTAKKEQGWIGKPVDWIKNLFKTKNCSNNIEKAINNLNENSTAEEIQAVETMLNKYSSNQDSAVKGTATTGAMVAGGALGAKFGAAVGTAICPGLGTAGGFICGVLIGAIAGAITNVSIHQVENMTDKVKGNSWHKDKNILKEAGQGALSGGSSVLIGGLTQKITGAVASKLGLTAVKNGGKTAFVALAEDGTAKVGSTVAKNAIAGAVGSGTAAAVVADGQYALECAVDKDKKFSLADLGTTTVSSLAVGGAIGGVTGGVTGYKGANAHNIHQAEIKAEAQARILKEQRELEAIARNNQEIHDMQYPSSTSEELKARPEFQNKEGGYSAEESAKFFEAQGKSEYELMLDRQEALALQKARMAAASQTAESAVRAPRPYGIDDKALRLGTSYLAQEGTPEYAALYDTVKEGFVVVRNKEEVMDIFRRQFSSVDVQGNDVLVLNPSNPAKVAKKINTSNQYMSEWFAEANGLEGKVVTVDTLQDAISNCSSKQITIFVPDDCAISGSSLIMNTTNAMNGLSIPEGTTVRLVYSPMIQSSTAEQAFTALKGFDIDALTELKVLSSTHNDNEIMRAFFEKFGKTVDISVADGGIHTKPFYKTESFIRLQQQNPEIAQAVEAILTNNGSATGFGRPGQSGVMIATPNADGVLKCPNNNPFGAAPYALAEGATPLTIKSPNGKNIGKWHTRLQRILEYFNKESA